MVEKLRGSLPPPPPAGSNRVKVIHFSTASFWEMDTWTKLDITRNQLAKFDPVKGFWSLRAWTIKRDIPIKRLRNGIFVKSNTKRFTEFTNCYLSQRLVEPSTSFPLIVPSRTANLGKDFSLQSLEFYSCIYSLKSEKIGLLSLLNCEAASLTV